MAGKHQLVAFALMAFSPFNAGAANANGSDDWQSHYQRAEQAYSRQDLFGARREFLTALKQAESCQQAPELAGRLESLANAYQLREQGAKAEPLIKLARKLRAKFSVAGTAVVH